MHHSLPLGYVFESNTAGEPDELLPIQVLVSVQDLSLTSVVH